jgi:ABC-2 type transport system permease protein
MRVWQLFIRNLRETYRDLLALGFLLAFPLLFMVVFGVAVGGGGTPTYNIAVIDQDNTQSSQAFVNQALTQVPTFSIKPAAGTGAALSDLKKGDLSAFIVIPQGFGATVAQKANIQLDITYDESDQLVQSSIISTVNAALRQFADIQVPITINANPTNVGRQTTQIDFLAPGIIVFGLLIMIPTAARIMLRDKETGYLSRLLTTPTRPWEFILGYTLCLLVIAVVQIIFFLIMGRAFGMDIAGNVALAFLVYTLTAVSSIGLGMVVASLAKTENQGEPLTWLFAMPLAALSGVWFSISFMPKYIQVFANLFPYAHAVSASREILIRGAGFAAVQSDLWFLVAWAAGATLLGILLFGRTMRS